MLFAFLRYFFVYIFRAKTRQHLLFLAVFGLSVSSFALLVLQSTMGGLQNKLINRAKRVEGHAVVLLNDKEQKFGNQVLLFLKDQKHEAYLEYEIELLLRHKDFITPVVVHALQEHHRTAGFLSDFPLNELILPYEMARRIDVIEGDEVKLISPGHVDQFLGDIPRQATLYVDHLINTEVPEVDSYHVWTRLAVVQNLIRAAHTNRIRLYNSVDIDDLRNSLNKHFPGKTTVNSWESMHETLVWALSLETTMMVFLFSVMTLLVSLCITSGLFIFFSKVRVDMASFWILGSSKANLEKASGTFLGFIGLGATLVGIVLGLVFLYFLDRYGINIMPDIFVDRKIPVYITTRGLAISFAIPFIISIVFSRFALSSFEKETDYLEHVRAVGA